MTPELADTIAEYEQLRTLLLRVDEAGIWYRAATPIGRRLRPGGVVRAVDGDRLFAALVSKAASTHKSIKLLIDAGAPEDALALARILIENGVVISWIRQNEAERLDAYWASLSLHQQRQADVIAEYYGATNPDIVKAAREAADDSKLLADLLGGKHHQWARKYDSAKGQFVSLNAYDLFEEVFKQPGVPRPMMYDLAYFRESAYVHSSIASLINLFDWTGRKVTIVTNNSDTDRKEALGVANLVMALIMNEFQGYLRWDIFEPELEALGRAMGANAGVGPIFVP